MTYGRNASPGALPYTRRDLPDGIHGNRTTADRKKPYFHLNSGIIGLKGSNVSPPDDNR